MVEPASKKSKNDFKLKIGKKMESEQQLIKLPNQEDSPMNIEKQSEVIVEVGQKQTSRNIFLEDFYILGAKEVNNSVWIYGKHNNKKIDIKILDFCKTLYIELMDEDMSLESLDEKFQNIKKKIKSIGDIACQKIVAQQIFREEQLTGKMFKLQIKGSYDWNNIEKRNQIVNIFRNERLMIYGHTVSLLEDFLLEKGIKGSCWLQIEDKISEFSPCIQAEKIKVKEQNSSQSLQTPQLVVILFTYSFQQQNLDYIIFNKATLNSQCQFESQNIQDHTVIYREHSTQIQTKQNGVKCVNTLSMLDRFKAEFKKADILIGYDLEPLKQIWRQNRKDEF